MLPVSDVIPPRSTPVVTIAIVVVTTLTFGYQTQLDGLRARDLTQTLGLVPAELSWTQLVTSLFVHDSWILVAGNMLYLWLFGGTLEDSMGRAAFLAFYLSAGALAGTVHAQIHAGSAVPLIGASGAVAAVVAAYFVLFPTSKVLSAVVGRSIDLVEVPAVFFLAGWLVLQIAGGLQSDAGLAGEGTVALAAQGAAIAAGGAAGGMLRWKGRRWEDERTRP